jgi:hypothetical protein
LVLALGAIFPEISVSVLIGPLTSKVLIWTGESFTGKIQPVCSHVGCISSQQDQYQEEGKIMNWNDELNGHLEVINARLAHLETMSMLANQRDDLAPAEYQLPAAPASGTVGLSPRSTLN